MPCISCVMRAIGMRLRHVGSVSNSHDRAGTASNRSGRRYGLAALVHLRAKRAYERHTVRSGTRQPCPAPTSALVDHIRIQAPLEQLARTSLPSHCFLLTPLATPPCVFRRVPSGQARPVAPPYRRKHP